MRPYFNKKKLFLIPFGIAAVVALVGFIVMGLWNALIPVIFHLGVITFWQALGIFVLCKILFGFGKGGHGGWRGKGPWMRGRMEERFKNMTPEEREKFKAKWEERCGHGRWGHHHDYSSFGAEWDKKAPEAEKTAE
jgi:hypothetical protein